jgi:hypothetical protein
MTSELRPQLFAIRRPARRPWQARWCDRATHLRRGGLAHLRLLRLSWSTAHRSFDDEPTSSLTGQRYVDSGG